MYINSLFLTLHNFDTDDYCYNIIHVEDQKNFEDSNNMNYDNESSIEMSHYPAENAKFAA